MGLSTINHSIRVKLKLNCLEYCFAEFVASDNVNKYSAADYLGISNKQIAELIDSLRAKEVFQKEDESRRVLVSEKWKSEFRITDRIDELWPLHRQGSKQKARERLAKVLQQTSMEELQTKLKAYVNACTASDSFPKNLDTWLNPKNKHWDDPLPQRRSLFKNPSQPKVDTTKYIIIK